MPSTGSPFYLLAAANLRFLRIFTFLAVLASLDYPTSADTPNLESGAQLYQAGRLEAAAHTWEEAVLHYEKAQQPQTQLATLIRLASVYQILGQHRLATATAEKALLLRSTNPSLPQAPLKNLLGTLAIFSRRYDDASALLQEALVAAADESNATTTASVLMNLGNLASAQQEPSRAIEYYNQSIAAAGRVPDPLMEARARVNASRALGQQNVPLAFEASLAAAERRIRDLPSGYEQASLYLALGQVSQQWSERLGRKDFASHAQRLYSAAQLGAQAIGDIRLQSYALGYLGQLYAREQQYADALRLFRRAIFHAEQRHMTDASYRWRWGQARCEAALGHRVSAVEHYRQAVESLQTIRHDLTVAQGNLDRPNSFRDSVGQLFTELADLLFQEADHKSDPDEVEHLLLEARATQEQLKAAELENYFRDECAQIAVARTVAVDAIDPHTAVLYLVPLPDRVELLLSIAGERLFRCKVPVSGTRLTKVSLEFRHLLEKRTTYEYLTPGRLLHDWLIAPLRPVLREHEINTLVFVPDGPLQAIPFAALVSGTNFLAEEFALGVTPGLSLMSARPLKSGNAQILLAGVSQGVQGFAELPFVEKELTDLRASFGGTLLLDESFRGEAFERQFSARAFSIIHIASHGEFRSEGQETFLLTYDGRLSLDQLERLIRPSRFRGQPLELLTLSACQTAAGDDRAALGLAGVALKAGARSALATLWNVNDEATALLIGNFYGASLGPRPLTKAKALQAAQKIWIADPRFQHPAHWSPYLLIGNWL